MASSDLFQETGSSNPSEGTGDSAGNSKVDPFTGRFTYSIPIKIPPARQGAQPLVALNYSSAGGNGWCGVGWTLETGYIERDTLKGVPVKWSTSATTPSAQYDDAKGFIANIGDHHGKLILIGSAAANPAIYRQQIETSFLTYKYFSDNHWEILDKSGNTFYLGEGATNRMENPKPGWTIGARSSTFRWVLDKVIDVNGNKTVLAYQKDEGQLYLSNISYNGNTNAPAIAPMSTIDFIVSGRGDTNISYRSNYRIAIGKRLSEIQIKVNGQNVRKYVLGYTDSSSTLRSLLTTLTEYGADYSTSLPAVRLSYQNKPLAFEPSITWTNLFREGTSSTLPAWGSVRGIDDTKETHLLLVDIDGDGLPDRVMRQSAPYTNYFLVQRNTGHGFAPSTTNYLWGPLDSGSPNYNWNSPIAMTDLGETHVDFLDINGDGYPDRVMRKVQSPYTNLFVQLNSGLASPQNGFDLATEWGALTNYETTPTNASWYSVRYGGVVDMMDYNGDGLPDRVSRAYDFPYDRYQVQINTGSGFLKPVYWMPLDSQGNTNFNWNSISRADATTNLFVVSLDINGDGLPDRVMRQLDAPYTNFFVQFNNGAGFEDCTNWMGVTSQGLTGNANWGSPIGSDGNQVWATLLDINGDGLPDRLMRNRVAPYTNWVVQINNGSGFGPEMDWIGLDSQGQTDAAWNIISGRGVGSVDTYLDLIDIDGDGLPDRVMRKVASPYTDYLVQLNKGPFPDLLCVISNGLGGAVDVTYAKSTSLDNRDKSWVADPWSEGARSLLPYNVWVVSSISSLDGMGNTNTSTYVYKNGFHDPVSRSFCGFGQVEVTDPAGAKMRTYFHQGGGRDYSDLGEYLDQNALGKNGIPFRVEVLDSAGSLKHITLNKIEELILNTNGWRFPFLSQSIAMDYEGEEYRATAKQLTYETNYGNIVADVNFGEVRNVDISSQAFDDIPGDSVYSSYSFASLTNVKNRPSNIRRTADSGGMIVLNEAVMSYDKRGNMTNSVAWLNTAGAFVTTASSTYDIYGNPTQTTDAGGVTTTIYYDSLFGQYGTTQVTGSFTNQFTHDPRSGAVLTGIDPKGLVASNSYDVFYRLKESATSVTPNGLPSLWRVRFDYVAGGVGNGRSTNYVRKRANNGIDDANGHQSYQYRDGLGRPIEVRLEAENAQYRVSHRVYDARGNERFTTTPYFDTDFTFGIPTGNLDGALAEYDDEGRPFRMTSAVTGTFGSNGLLQATTVSGGDLGSPIAPVTTTWGEAGNPWVTISTDACGKISKRYHDASGLITNLVNVTAAGNIVTTFRYNLLGNLTNIIDGVGNTTVIVYDSLGRKTQFNDPDSGIWQYRYDNVGRLVEQSDARGNKLKFAYDDEIRRMTSKEVYNADGKLVRKTSYTYDVSDDSTFTVFKGQLYKIGDSEGVERFSYDVQGHVLKSARYLNINSMEYVTQRTYDAIGRLQQLVYPENAATIKYSYDSVGNIIEVKSLAGTGTQEVFYASPTFDVMGGVTSFRFGNGVLTTNSYYANSKRIQNTKVSIGSNIHEDLTFTFDSGANFKSIIDGAYTGAACATISDAQYDDLHRLTSLTSSANGTKSFSYSAIGNISVNQDNGVGTYVYGPRPHAVTSANGKAYLYDASGNMVQRGNQILSYDEENRLTAVDAVRFGYADGGIRLWRSGTNGWTIWMGAIYELNNGKALCHVFAGNRRVATFEPQCGGPWARVIGEDRYYASLGLIDRALSWPFRGGRSPWSYAVINFIGVLAVCTAGRRAMRIRAKRMRKASFAEWCVDLRALHRPAWNSRRVGHQIIAFGCIFAMTMLSAQRVEAQTMEPLFYYYHGDNVAGTTILTNRAGERVKHYSYSAYGHTTFTEDADGFGTSNRYSGQILDEETGLYFYNARYYDPELGRFTQPDTVIPSACDSQQLNRYTYCSNNPLNYTDPSGHSVGLLIGLALAFVFGAAVGAIISVSYAAWTGGDLGMAALNGAIIGGLANVGGAFGPLGLLAAGAAAGAISAAIAGQDIGSGALMGSITSAINIGVGGVATGIFEDIEEGLVKHLAQVAVAAAISGATQEVAGGDFWQGFTFSAALNGAHLINAYARLATAANSELDANDPANFTHQSRNSSGISESHWSDFFKGGIKYAGVRFSDFYNAFKSGILGGSQGQNPGTFISKTWTYEPGSWQDVLCEDYSGIHDLLAQPFAYNEYGNGQYGAGTLGGSVTTVMSTVNVFIATPFAAATLMVDFNPWRTVAVGFK